MATSSKRETYECKFTNHCAKHFSSRWGLRKHVTAIHKKIQFTCPTCGKQFPYSSSLKIHIASIHKGKRYLCRICGTDFSDKRNYHIPTVHDGEHFSCIQCIEASTVNSLHEDNIKEEDIEEVLDKD